MASIGQMASVVINGKRIECHDLQIDPGVQTNILERNGLISHYLVKVHPKVHFAIQPCNFPIDALRPPAIEVLFDKRKVWVFPTNEPFVIYERSDESWCRYCRIGHEVEVQDVLTVPYANVSIDGLNRPDPQYIVSGDAIPGERVLQSHAES